jgi:hypothetical protein
VKKLIMARRARVRCRRARRAPRSGSARRLPAQLAGGDHPHAGLNSLGDLGEQTACLADLHEHRARDELPAGLRLGSLLPAVRSSRIAAAEQAREEAAALFL